MTTTQSIQISNARIVITKVAAYSYAIDIVSQKSLSEDERNKILDYLVKEGFVEKVLSVE